MICFFERISLKQRISEKVKIGDDILVASGDLEVVAFGLATHIFASFCIVIAQFIEGLAEQFSDQMQAQSINTGRCSCKQYQALLFYISPIWICALNCSSPDPVNAISPDRHSLESKCLLSVRNCLQHLARSYVA